MKRTLLGGLAVLTLLAAAAPTASALAQDHRGGDRRDGGHRDGDRGRGDGAFIGGLALGAALGSYAGHPYYCRNHHHWRWSIRLHRYVAVTSRGHYC
jgi:hypothetical protein